MRTKRKRATRKPPPRPKNPPSPPTQNEEACSNFVAQNTHPKPPRNPPNAVEVNRSDSTDSSSASSDSDESFNVGDSISEDSVVNRRLTRSAKASQQSKKRVTGNPNSASNLPSSSRKRNQLGPPHHDSLYNTEELKAALLVVEKVMQMEEVQPFNVRVDPVALGREDYYDIIHTPMDFGTVSRNLQDGVKYMNSSDVYNDVELIWDNCLKLYKKSDYIVYLMKRVKKKFIKYWTAAGLGSGQSRISKVGHPHLQHLVHVAQRHNQHVPGGPVDQRTGGHHIEFQNQQTHLSHKHASDQQMARQRVNQLDPSHLQGAVDTGHSQIKSDAGCIRFIEQINCHSLDPMLVEASQLAPEPSHVSSRNLKEPSVLQPSCIQPQSSRVQANVEIENSHHSLTDSAMRGINCALRYTLGPTTDQSNHENGHGLGPSEAQQDQTPQSCREPTKESRSRRNPKKTKRKVVGVTHCISLRNLVPDHVLDVHAPDPPIPGAQPDCRLLIKPLGSSTFEPDKATRLITPCITGHFDGPWANWSSTPPDVIQEWWNSFKTRAWWDPSHDREVWEVFNKLGANHLRSLLHEVRKEPTGELRRKKASFMTDDAYRRLEAYWASPEFQAKSAKGRASRAFESASYTGGSISNSAWRRRLQEQDPKKKDPGVFKTFTRTHKTKAGVYVDSRAATTAENYMVMMEEATQLQEEGGGQVVDEVQIFTQAAGGKKKGRVYGMGTENYLTSGHRRPIYGGPLAEPKDFVQTPEFKAELARQVAVETAPLRNQLHQLYAHFRLPLSTREPSLVHEDTPPAAEVHVPADHEDTGDD